MQLQSWISNTKTKILYLRHQIKKKDITYFKTSLFCIFLVQDMLCPCIIYTYNMLMWFFFCVFACLLPHPSCSETLWKQPRLSFCSPPSPHTHQQLVKRWPLSFPAPLFPVHSNTLTHTAYCFLFKGAFTFLHWTYPCDTPVKKVFGGGLRHSWKK